jgi:hypothetical protein
LRIDLRIQDDGVIVSGETACGMSITVRQKLCSNDWRPSSEYRIRTESGNLRIAGPNAFKKQFDCLENWNTLATVIVFSNLIIKFRPVFIYHKWLLVSFLGGAHLRLPRRLGMEWNLTYVPPCVFLACCWSVGAAEASYECGHIQTFTLWLYASMHSCRDWTHRPFWENPLGAIAICHECFTCVCQQAQSDCFLNFKFCIVTMFVTVKLRTVFLMRYVGTFVNSFRTKFKYLAAVVNYLSLSDWNLKKIMSRPPRYFVFYRSITLTKVALSSSVYCCYVFQDADVVLVLLPRHQFAFLSCCYRLQEIKNKTLECPAVA